MDKSITNNNNLSLSKQLQTQKNYQLLKQNLNINLKKIFEQVPEISELDKKKQENRQELDLNEEDENEIQKKTGLSFKGNIGFGGFSTVKLAFSEQYKSYYAVKIINLLNPKKFRKKTISKRKDFVDHEILINYNSKHPNIVKLYGYLNFKHYYLLILEFLQRKDLKCFIKKFYKTNNHMSEVLAAYFIIEILKGLKYLQSNHILHRDLKPENIMLSGDFIPKIGDFSLSKKVDNDKKFTTSRSGTIPYLPPESIKDKGVVIKGSLSERLDVFSLGVVFYYMLFNEHPFNYKNGMSYEDYFENMRGEPSYFSSACQNISQQGKSLLKGMLDKNINTRLSLEQVLNHPFLSICKTTIEEIKENFSNDPEKIIVELNKVDVREVVNKEEFTNEEFMIESEEYKINHIFLNMKRRKEK